MLNTHHCSRRRVNRFYRLLVSLVKQSMSSTSRAHASPHAIPSSSSRMRHDSPSNVIHHSSAHMRQVSPVPPFTIDIVDSVPPPTADVVDPVPPPEGQAGADVELKAFGEGPIDFSLLSMYPYHISKHIWDREVSLVGFIIFYLWRGSIYYFFRSVIHKSFLTT